MANKFSNNVDLQFPFEQAVTFDIEEFDSFVRSQGIKLVHYRAMPCPVGKVDINDIRRPHEDHEGCSNGFIFIKSGLITCLFQGNTNSYQQLDIGLLDGSTVRCTAPRFYDDTQEEVSITPFDRFYLLDEAIVVPNWELVEAHITGKDRLKFPATSVSDIIDSKGKRYYPSDYTIEKGQIAWNQGKGPGFDPYTNKGLIYSTRYFYKPYWYVSRVLHQIRVAQTESLLERSVVRLPHEFMLTREYVSMNEDKDPDAKDPNSEKQVRGPRQMSLGPR